MDTVYENKAQQSWLLSHNHKWVRSNNGMISGVCEGLGESFEISPNLLRLGWLASIFLFGTGILAYVVLAICLPKKEQSNIYEAKIMGVCSRISKKSNIEIGIVRVLAVLLAFASLGSAILIYFLLNFLISEESN